MRTFHLIAALALVVGKAKAADYDAFCGGDLTWDNDGPGFADDEGNVISCGEIGAYADSLGAGADTACGNPALSGASVEPDADQTNVWLVIDDGACCGTDGYNKCGADPRGICADPNMWDGDAIEAETGQACDFLAAFLSSPMEGRPSMTGGEQFPDSCHTCASSYMQMFDMAASCCNDTPVVCSGEINYGCFDEGSGSGSGSGSEGSNNGPSEECMTGCAKDCYGSMDFMNGDRWNKEQCVCLVTDCYDSRDCNDDDVEFLEDFVDTGCGAEDSSYDYSYDYSDVEAIAAEDGEGDGVARAALASAAVVVGAALLF